MSNSAEHVIRDIDVEEFVLRLRAETNADKRFALFLGAGCSVSSGIPAAGALVKDRWIPRLREFKAPRRSDVDNWAREAISDYDPDQPALSYGKLIDQLFLTPDDRQREIEMLCDSRTPSFGYAVLAQLVAMKEGRFNIVLTTNFDDLIADALYLYTEARPLVIHHESLAAYIRPTRTRPLIVKLHGDHRLSPRNTALETQTLEQGIQRQTAMVLHDRGVIFMGYAGADEGILKLLDELPPEALPYGAYWVHPQEPQGKVREWLSRRQGVWVRSGWFDEVMLLMRNAFELPHPKEKRFTLIFQNYHQKFQELSTAIQQKPPEAPGVQALQKALTDTEALFPDYWKALSEARRLEHSDPDRADQIFQQGISQFPQAAPLLGDYATFLIDLRKDYDAADAMYKRALEADPNDAENLDNYATFLSDQRQDYDAAEAMYRRALEADPEDANVRANLARLLLAVGRAEGRAVLHEALSLLDDVSEPQVELECAFYLFAHGTGHERAEGLKSARELIESGVRSREWDLSRNVERAQQDGHPDGAWLGKLAAVINDEAKPGVLDDWPAWRGAAAT